MMHVFLSTSSLYTNFVYTFSMKSDCIFKTSCSFGNLQRIGVINNAQSSWFEVENVALCRGKFLSNTSFMKRNMCRRVQHCMRGKAKLFKIEPETKALISTLWLRETRSTTGKVMKRNNEVQKIIIKNIFSPQLNSLRVISQRETIRHKHTRGYANAAT